MKRRIGLALLTLAGLTVAGGVPWPPRGTRVEGRDSLFTLPDGRRLAWAEYGDPRGTPIVYLHGTMSSRLEPLCWLPPDLKGVRLIAVDRPGYGLSDAQTAGSLLEFAGDIRALVDHLGITRFRIIGASGGGPFAMAVARSLKDRVDRLSLVCAVAPGDLEGGWKNVPDWAPDSRRLQLLAMVYSTLGRAVLRWLPDGALALLFGRLGRLPAVDRACLDYPAIRAHGRSVPLEGIGRSSAGLHYDLRVIFFVRSGFQLSEIDCPADVWWGEQDPSVSRGMTLAIMAGLRHAVPHLMPGDGHLSLVPRNAVAILAAASN
jgi:pimeloyl-ACP methyl ester carboxylesterase